MCTNAVTRFWSHVDRSAGKDNCWIWTGSVDKWGYGQVYWNGERARLAHRIAYQIAYGEVPKGLFVRHFCNNPSCVNSTHLFLGAHSSGHPGQIVADTKVCSRCREGKPLSEFHFKNKEKGTRNAYCRECTTRYGREHYHRNITRERPRRVAYGREKLRKLRAQYFEYLKTHPCVDCGESDPMVLEFDHVCGEKRGEVSTLLNHRINWEGILAEIKKCDVVCANCHRRRTAKQRKWYEDLV